MKKILWSLALTLGAVQGAFAQGQQSAPTKVRPAQVSVVPGLSTNGLEATAYHQPFSFNLLGGYNGGVSGFELGSIFNMDKYFVHGVQIAGVANVVGGPVDGIQLAGVLNKAGDHVKGAQLAGVLNMAGDSSSAWQAAGVANLSKGGMNNSQWAGVANIAGGEVRGAQLSGVVNVAKERVQGLQAAGVANIAAGGMDGTQLAGVVNVVRGKASGLQAGVINISESTKGLQLGVVNIADTAAGLPLGLVNIVRKGGYYKGEAWGSETFYANAAFKMGVTRLYTILTAGWQTKDGDYRLGYGIGLGSVLASSPSAALSFDLISYNVSENRAWNNNNNLLEQARLMFSKNLTEGTSILMGATFNVFISDYNAEAGEVGMELAPWNVYSEMHGKSRVTMWPGANFGFRF